MGNDTRGLPQDAVDQLTARLAALADLRLPAQLRRQQPEGPPQGELRRHLAQLLRQDPGVFLERHGASLTEQELEHFQCLRWAAGCARLQGFRVQDSAMPLLRCRPLGPPP